MRVKISKHSKKVYRSRRVLNSAQGPVVVVGTRELINFCSNDYLGLANDEEISSAFIRGAEEFGFGSGSSQYVCGYSRAHQELEQTIIETTGFEDVVCFSSGYMANLSVISSCLGRNDHVYIDRLAHASIYDAAVLSRAKIHRYPHLNPGHLNNLFDQVDQGRKMIVTDGVFSMDGDIAPIQELTRVGKKFHCGVYVDDAHGFGVLGEHGLGVLSEQRINPDSISYYMATFGKACGGYGSFVAGSRENIEHLKQSARPLIYTTALPAAVAVAVRLGLRKLYQEDWRREKLRSLIGLFRSGAKDLSLPVLDSYTAIQPIMLKDNERARLVSERLLDKGFLVSAIRPPTVPAGTARLRITLTAVHTREQISKLLEALEETCLHIH